MFTSASTRQTIKKKQLCLVVSSKWPSRQLSRRYGQGGCRSNSSLASSSPGATDKAVAASETSMLDTNPSPIAAPSPSSFCSRAYCAMMQQSSRRLWYSKDSQAHLSDDTGCVAFPAPSSRCCRIRMIASYRRVTVFGGRAYAFCFRSSRTMPRRKQRGLRFRFIIPTATGFRCKSSASALSIWAAVTASGSLPLIAVASIAR
mmetsp:Transcript_69609/g.166078  ORF Transcript_69609/g.166078 Transcript_69609/m.166078 type:complete len:203 (+) Transcript_69609:120-728(+)